jgi:elongation factor Tu
VTGTLEVEEPVVPGGRARVRFVLDRAVALDKGVRFALREGKRTIGAGLVVGVD